MREPGQFLLVPGGRQQAHHSEVIFVWWRVSFLFLLVIFFPFPGRFPKISELACGVAGGTREGGDGGGAEENVEANGCMEPLERLEVFVGICGCWQVDGGLLQFHCLRFLNCMNSVSDLSLYMYTVNVHE